MRGCPEAGDVSAQTGSIGKILRPTNGGGRGILDDALPLLHRAAHHHGGPSTRCLTSRIAPAPAVDEGARVTRIRQAGAHRLLGGLAPSHGARSHADDVPPGPEDLLLVALAHDLEGRA